MISIITSTTDIEPSVGFFLECLTDVQHVFKSAEQLENIKTVDQLMEIFPSWNILILCGNYFKNLEIPSENNDIFIFKFSDGSRPLTEIINFLTEKEYLKGNVANNFFLSKNSKVINSIDQRLINRDCSFMQEFFLGLKSLNLDKTIETQKTVFIRVFCEQILYDDLVKMGNYMRLSQCTLNSFHESG